MFIKFMVLLLRGSSLYPRPDLHQRLYRPALVAFGPVKGEGENSPLSSGLGVQRKLNRSISSPEKKAAAAADS